MKPLKTRKLTELFDETLATVSDAYHRHTHETERIAVLRDEFARRDEELFWLRGYAQRVASEIEDRDACYLTYDQWRADNMPDEEET